MHPINIVGYSILIIGGLFMFYPLVFMILASVMSKIEFFNTQIGVFPIAKNPSFANLKSLIDPSSANSLLIRNTLIRTIYTTTLTIITSMLSGYAFNRLRFRFKNELFFGLLFAQMLPAVSLIVPTYIVYARWPFAGGNNIFFGGKGILDTWYIYLLGPLAINIIGTFLVKQSLEKVPIDLDEAAKVDGAGLLRLVFQILMPVQKPILAYIAITTAIANWNDWLVPFFYSNSKELQTLSSAITRIAIGDNIVQLPDYPLIISLGFGLTIPSLLLFLDRKSVV